MVVREGIIARASYTCIKRSYGSLRENDRRIRVGGSRSVDPDLHSSKHKGSNQVREDLYNWKLEIVTSNDGGSMLLYYL